MLNGRWFPQIVDEDSGNLYPIYNKKIVVLASEPVGGRSWASCLVPIPTLPPVSTPFKIFLCCILKCWQACTYIKDVIGQPP